MRRLQCLVLLTLALAWTTSLRGLMAQSAETPVFDQSSESKTERERIAEETRRLREEKKLISKQEIDRQLADPQPEPVELQAVRTRAMTSEEIAAHARMTNLRVGYCYLCQRCDDWHVTLAGGYAIAPDTIVTCDHVVDTRTKMREGYLVAVDHEGNVAGAVAILARSKAMDVAVVKMAGARFEPLPLNRNVKQGTPSYCFSHPLRQRGYFSAGIINRFYWNQSYGGEDKDSMDALRHLRTDFSNDWAPGSSGSPLFDQAGNVIGHVSTIAGLGHGKNKPALMTLHTGIPAQCVERLVQAMDQPEEIRRIAALDAEKKADDAKTTDDKPDKPENEGE